MITQYHRPQTLEEALQLLARADTRPLGGGTVLTQRSDSFFSVVDLQALGLDKLRKSGDNLEIGATVTLQNLLESLYIAKSLKVAIALETPFNLRTMGTVAGTLVTCDGRSPFTTVMLALDAKIIFAPGNEQITLGNFLPLRVGGDSARPISPAHPNQLITKVEIPLNAKLAFETVAGTPAGKPIVCAALAQWPSGRTRLALGGWGQAPALALDGNESGGLQEAALNACSEAADDWASAEYRREIAAVLANRCQYEIVSF